MRLAKFKKTIRSIAAVIAVFTAVMSVCSAAYADVNDEPTPVYSQDFENARRFQYSSSDGEGKEDICSSDSYSGEKCSQITLGSGGYGSVRFYTDWNGKWEDKDKNSVFTEGKTYIMSFKAKKSPGANVRFYAVRYDDKSYNWHSELRNEYLSDAWKVYNYIFTAASGSHLNQSPALMFRGAIDDVVYIDDVKFFEFDNAAAGELPDAEVLTLTSEKLTLKYTSAVSKDALNPKSYTIGGVAAESVMYDETSNEYSVVPSAALDCGETADISISISDIHGRAVNVTKSDVYVDYPAETTYTTSLGDETADIDSIDRITFTFSNTMDEETVLNIDNYALSGSDNTISSIIKLDERTYTVCFNDFLTDNRSYTLTVNGLKDKYNRNLSDISVSFNIRQVLPKLIESDPSNRACGIPKGSLKVTLKFNKEIKADSLGEITVSGGAVIESSSVSGSIVTLNLSGLNESSTYEIVIKGVRDLNDTEAEETRLTFCTELPLITIYENNFSSSDDIDYRRFGVGGEAEKQLNTDDYVTGPSSAKVEMMPNNDLVMERKSDASEYSAEDVKIELGKKYTGTFYVKFIEGSSLTGLRIVNGDNKSYITGVTSEITENGWKKYTYEFTASSGNQSDKNSGKMKAPTIRFVGEEGNRVKGAVLFDDWSIKQYPDAEVTDSSISEGEENVSVSEAISFNFNGEIQAASASIGDVTCDVSINGGTVVCVPKRALEYGRYYELELVTTDSNGVINTFKRRFKTEHSAKISRILANGKIYSNESEMTAAISEGLTLDIAVAGETMYVTAALFDGADGYMKGVWCKAVTSGAIDIRNADMTAVNAASGDKIKVFFWSGFNKTEIIHEPIVFTLK